MVLFKAFRTKSTFSAAVCDAGAYLSLTEQKCLPCAAGTFSLGGGVRYEDFSKDDLPSVLTIKNEHVLGGEADCPKKFVDEMSETRAKVRLQRRLASGRRFASLRSFTLH